MGLAAIVPAFAQSASPQSAQDVEFTNQAAGVRLSGTLTLPQGQGPFPAVILVSGSGPQNRDEEILGHKPFFVIADYLASRGIAALRYDDRGIGGSSGNFAAATTYDFAGDARAAVAFLSARPEIDPSKVGVVGHSEGGIIAALLGASDPAVSFVVMLAGPGIRGDKLLLSQNRALAEASGLDEGTIKEANLLNARLYAIAMEQGDEAETKAKIISALPAAVDGKTAGIIADQLLSPWIRTFLALDPSAALAALRIPLLAMNGTKDLQVPADENLKAIGLALDASGNKNYSLLELEGLNHLFQHAVTGLPNEYAAISETFAPEALAALGDWILSTAH